jgi:hypothetical protein
MEYVSSLYFPLWYYRQGLSMQPPRTSTLSRPHAGATGGGSSAVVAAGLRSNSLPRDHRGRSHHAQPGQMPRHHMVRFERESRGTGATGLLDQEDSDGAVSAPELPVTRRERGNWFSFL